MRLIAKYYSGCQNIQKIVLVDVDGKYCELALCVILLECFRNKILDKGMKESAIWLLTKIAHLLGGVLQNNHETLEIQLIVYWIYGLSIRWSKRSQQQ